MPPNKDHTGKKWPYQKWYEADFLASATVSEMSWQAKLLNRAMLQKAFHFGAKGLPSNLKDLSRLLGVPQRHFSLHLDAVLMNFSLISGRYYNERVLKDLGIQLSECSGEVSEKPPTRARGGGFRPSPSPSPSGGDLYKSPKEVFASDIRAGYLVAVRLGACEASEAALLRVATLYFRIQRMPDTKNARARLIHWIKRAWWRNGSTKDEAKAVDVIKTFNLKSIVKPDTLPPEKTP